MIRQQALDSFSGYSFGSLNNRMFKWCKWIESFFQYQHCASYSRTFNCPGLLLSGMLDILLFQDGWSPYHMRFWFACITWHYINTFRLIDWQMVGQTERLGDYWQRELAVKSVCAYCWWYYQIFYMCSNVRTVHARSQIVTSRVHRRPRHQVIFSWGCSQSAVFWWSQAAG